MLAWLTVQALALSCVVVERQPALVDPGVREVPADYHPVLKASKRDLDAPLDTPVLRSSQGDLLSVSVEGWRSGDEEWWELTPVEPLQTGLTYEVMTGEARVAGEFTVGAVRSAPPPVVQISYLANQDGTFGEHYTFSGPHFISLTGPAGPAVWLDVEGPRWAGRLEVAYTHDDEFADSVSAWTPAVVGRVPLGVELCGDTNAELVQGRRTFFKVRAVGLNGATGPWSEVASVEIGNLDSRWPRINLASFAALTPVEYGIRAAIVVAAILVCLVGWMLVVLRLRAAERGWRGQRNE